MARHRHRVPEPERIALAHVVDVGEVGRELHFLQQVVLAVAFEVVLELEVAVEVVFDRALVAARDDEDVGEAGAHRFFDDVLDRGPVDDRQHLLGRALRGRQEARAEPGGGDHGLAHWAHTEPPGLSRGRSLRAARDRRMFAAWRATTSTASAASDRDLPQVVSGQRRRRPGTAPSRAATRATPCAARAPRRTRRPPRPDDDQRVQHDEHAARRPPRPCRPCGRAGTCGRRPPRRRARTRRGGRRPRGRRRRRSRPWRSRAASTSSAGPPARGGGRRSTRPGCPSPP